jgi:PAS domain-containing protein
VGLLAGGSPLYDSEGRHFANLGMYSDITERKKGEEALRESERRYRSLFENLHEGVALMRYVLDESGHVTDLLYVDVNEAVIAEMDRPREEIIGVTIRQLMGPEESADLVMMASEARSGGGTVSFETSSPSGQAYFLNFLAPVSDEMCIISSLDITSTREAKQRAEENRAQLRAIIENSPVAVVVADERSRIILTNKAADEIFRRPIPFMERYESQASLRLYHPDGRPYDPRDLPLTRSALDGERSTGVGMDIVWPRGRHGFRPCRSCRSSRRCRRWFTPPRPSRARWGNASFSTRSA